MQMRQCLWLAWGLTWFGAAGLLWVSLAAWNELYHVLADMCAIASAEHMLDMHECAGVVMSRLLSGASCPPCVCPVMNDTRSMYL
jgi:hypothetical protein